MYLIKSTIFKNLTTSQKSQICNYLSKFTKKHLNKPQDEIFEIFVEDELYYLELDTSRHPWIVDYIEDKSFQKDIKLYINDQIKTYKEKERIKPILDKQKEFNKQQRKRSQENKMSKESPTKAQISYYKSLCKRHDEEMKIDCENASKLDLRNEIRAILEKYSDKKEVLSKLNELSS